MAGLRISSKNENTRKRYKLEGRKEFGISEKTHRPDHNHDYVASFLCNYETGLGKVIEKGNAYKRL